METFIKVSKDELNNDLIKKIISMLSGVKNPDITIRIADKTKNNYNDELNESIKQFERGEVKAFTMDELIDFSKSTK